MAVFTGNGAVGSPSFTFSSDTDTGMYRPGANQLALATAGGDRLFCTADGRVIAGGNTLVNTDGVFGGFQFNTSTGNQRVSTVSYFGDDTSGPALALAKSRGTSVGSIVYPSSGDNLGLITFGGANQNNARINSSVVISAAAAQTWTSGSQGSNLAVSLCANGGPITPSLRFTLTQDGYARLASGTGGIQFNGDTAAANALDDYEEGTWTLTGISKSAGGFGSPNARYIKIGSQVTCFFSFEMGTSTLTISNTISGLPFSLAANKFYIGGTWGRNIVTGSSYIGDVLVTAGGNSLRVINNPAPTAIDGFGARVNLMFTYTTLS